MDPTTRSILVNALLEAGKAPSIAALPKETTLTAPAFTPSPTAQKP